MSRKETDTMFIQELSSYSTATGEPSIVALIAFLVADADVDICGDGDILLVTGLGELTPEVVLERRMSDSYFRVIIGNTEIAPGRKDNVVNSALLDFVRDCVKIEIPPHIRTGRHGMEIEKQTVLWNMHFLFPYISSM